MSLGETAPVSTPTGLCVLTGTPSTGGDFSFVVQVSDSASHTATQSVAFVVVSNSAPTISAINATSSGCCTEVITWTTSTAADSQVVWGQYGDLQFTTPEQD